MGILNKTDFKEIDLTKETIPPSPITIKLGDILQYKDSKGDVLFQGRVARVKLTSKGKTLIELKSLTLNDYAHSEG